jgi:hypothetical protein
MSTRHLSKINHAKINNKIYQRNEIKGKEKKIIRFVENMDM